MYKLHLRIPWNPASLNKTLSKSWQARHKVRGVWGNYIWAETQGLRPDAPLKKAKITLIRHGHRTLDFDGCVGSCKPVVDAIVQAGILKDDSWKVLGAWVVDQQFRPKKDGPLLEILIEEID